MWKLLDRQMVFNYIKAYLVCLVSLMGLFIVVDLFMNLDDFIQAHNGFGSVMEHIGLYYSQKSLQVFDRLCESIVLLSAMFTVAWMQRNNELLPLLSAGVSARRVVRPVLISACLVMGLCVFNQEFVLPNVDNYLVENQSCVIVGVQATAARMSQETVAAQAMLTRFSQWQGRGPESVAADTTYANGEFLQWLADRTITPYMRTRASAKRKNSPFYGPEHFTYQPESKSYRCSAGEQLNYVGLNVRNRAQAYIGSTKCCGACCQKTKCTSGRYKYLAIHMDELARQRARELANTPEFAYAQRQRKKVEALFAELKNQIGLRRVRLRRLKFVQEQFFLAAAAQNIKRLVRFLSPPTNPVLSVPA